MAKPAKLSRKEAKPAAEPRLGIFWLVDGKLLIDSAPLSECEQYGDHRNYPGSHSDVWELWLRVGKAPAPSEYEEFPRGRTMYSTSTNTFTLLADRCILKRKELIAKIKEELRLPKQTPLGTDSHYRCFHCLHGSQEEE
jgi:hypothetical protein